jgi:hypothetical protein
LEKINGDGLKKEKKWKISPGLFIISSLVFGFLGAAVIVAIPTFIFQVDIWLTIMFIVGGACSLAIYLIYYVWIMIMRDHISD